LNGALKQVSADFRKTLSAKLFAKQKREGRKSITEAERRRCELSKTHWQDWDVPFDTDPDWPPSLREALTAYRSQALDAAPSLRCEPTHAPGS